MLCSSVDQPVRRVLSCWWVFLILAIGVLVGLPMFVRTSFDHPPIFRARSDLQVLAAALKIFRDETGAYPTEDDGLAALVLTVIGGYPQTRGIAHTWHERAGRTWRWRLGWSSRARTCCGRI